MKGADCKLNFEAFRRDGRTYQKKKECVKIGNQMHQNKGPEAAHQSMKRPTEDIK